MYKPINSSGYPFKRACNYYCEVCRKTDKTPNMAGRFYIISETECQCSGCNTVFDKDSIYKRGSYTNNCKLQR